MSAEAVYQKWLQLENQSALPIISTSDTKSEEQTALFWQIMEFVIYAALYVLLRYLPLKLGVIIQDQCVGFKTRPAVVLLRQGWVLKYGWEEKREN